jgi:nucleotide-binding universal stress UspA family protein
MEWLIYVDPSPRGEWALSLAAQLPGRTQAAVALLATDEDAAREPGLLARARERLAPTASARELVRTGPAERAVVAETSSRRYDLLIVPPAGRGAIERMLRGSRVATVVRSVRAPVLVARRPPPRLGRILAAVSGGRSTEAVCRRACDLASGLGAEVAFLHVISEIAVPFGPHGPAGEPAAEPRVEDAEEEARRVLRRLGREGALLRREGLVVDEVLSEFESGGYDLLVVGAREEAAWGREDVTERLLLRCPGSTLVVPR